MFNPVECFGTLPQFLIFMSRRKPRRNGSVRSDGHFTGTPIPGILRDSVGGSSAVSTPVAGFGKSVAPGSISLPNHDENAVWHSQPDNIYNPRMEGANTSEWIYALLQNLNKGGSLSQGYSDVLGRILDALNQQGIHAALDPDMINALFTSLLQYQSTVEGREYDYKMLNESRQYNNPLNELARLMGSGISRDAAIQILSGSAGGTGVGSSAGVSPVSSPVAGAGAAALNGSNAQSNLVNNIFNGVQLVCNLLNQGVDLYSSIQTAEMLTAQNQMSQAQLQAFQGVNNITQAFDAAVRDGVLSLEDVQGLRSADDYYKWITDHADSNLVKPLFQNGSVSSAFGTTYGRSMLNKHLDETRMAKDSGTLFDNFVRRSIAERELSEIEPKKAYQDLLYAIGELSRQDAEIQKTWNDVWAGNVQIEIAGKELKLKSFEVNQADAYNDVFNAAMRQTGETPNLSNLGTGQQFLAYDMWSDLYMQFCDAFSKTGTSQQRDSWERFFKNNVESAQLLAGLKLNMSQIQASAANPDLNPLTSTLIGIWQIAQMTGAYDVLKFGVENGADYLKLRTLMKNK